MFVSFHSKLVLNTRAWCCLFLSVGAPFLISRPFANGLLCPCELALWRWTSSLASRGSMGDQLRASLLLVGPSVPANGVHCKADPQDIQKPQSQALKSNQCEEVNI